MLEKTYDPKSIEKNIYQTWEKNGYFKPANQGESYCIMLPPPNVTGTLHMGHGFQDAIMDALIRYHRMRGFNTLWQPGVDHAGIATQMVVERQLLQKGQSRHDFGREAFVKKVWEWKETSGDIISSQMRRLGASPDWEHSRFTMDEGLSEAVSDVFEQLYDEGLIYRGKRLVNWDPVLLTAVSDLEVLNEEVEGSMWYIRYPLADGSGDLIIATTRPETMLGDTAIAVHPDDKRFTHLIGKTAKLPLTDREIIIIADDYVDPEFGTGCVKITPAHDFNDYAIGQRHELEMINVLTPDAKINENAPKKYQGLDRFEARKIIVNDLEKEGYLVKIEKHLLKVPKGDRTKTIIEPYLTDQWFVKIEPLAQPAIKAVESGKIKFIPEHWSKTYYQWMFNIQDWCISRQLWWGHRIPAWYDKDGNIYVGKNENEVRKKYSLSKELKLNQDEDVLDTWFSAALWPFSTLGWPEKTKRLEIFYPTNVLVTGFDIIFFWVARMIMFGLKFMNEIPFSEVYITGLIRDAEGQKMSKSKGNVLDPIDLIDGISLEDLIAKRTFGLMQPDMKKTIIENTKKQFPKGIAPHGTDALRLTFCSLASYSRDINFDVNRLEGNRNFCNKLWNASRYVFMQTENVKPLAKIDFDKLSLPDKWIWSRLQKTIAAVHEHFKTYRFDLLTQALYDFTWREYCDWYLEFTKPILNSDTISEEEKNITRNNLLSVLDILLRLAHPIIPFITEALWQQVAEKLTFKGNTIMLASYPEIDVSFINEEIEGEMEWLQTAILGIRNIRGEMNIAPGKLLPVILHQWNNTDKKRLEKYELLLKQLARIESITLSKKEDKLPNAATTLVGNMKLLIPLAGIIDIDAETARLKKEIEKLNTELTRSEGKLNNPSFVEKAPEAIIVKEKDRVEELQSAIGNLKGQLAGLKTL